MNGLYWGLTALHLMNRPDALPREGTVEFVLSCQPESGGFGAAPGHDAHLLYTVSAVQILATVDALGVLEKRGRGGLVGVGNCMTSFPSPSDFLELYCVMADSFQILRPFKTATRARSQAMNGVKKTRDSFTPP